MDRNTSWLTVPRAGWISLPARGQRWVDPEMWLSVKMQTSSPRIRRPWEVDHATGRGGKAREHSDPRGRNTQDPAPPGQPLSLPASPGLSKPLPVRPSRALRGTQRARHPPWRCPGHRGPAVSRNNNPTDGRRGSPKFTPLQTHVGPGETEPSGPEGAGPVRSLKRPRKSRLRFSPPALDLQPITLVPRFESCRGRLIFLSSLVSVSKTDLSICQEAALQGRAPCPETASLDLDTLCRC